MQGKLDEAEALFKEHLEKYPETSLTSNSHYWLGEIYFKQKKYALAAKQFSTGYQNNPKSHKAPDLLLKLAMALEKRGEKKQCCAVVKSINHNHPNPPSHIKRPLQSLNNRLKCIA